MSSQTFQLRARWIVPVASPPIEGGHVLVDHGVIRRVESTALGGVPVTDLGDVILTPGFVNAHTHLEMTRFRGLLEPAPLWPWLNAQLQLRRQPGAAEAMDAAVAEGAAESLAHGVTCVGDISRTARHVRRLSRSPIRSVCFCELISGAADKPSSAAELAGTMAEFDALNLPQQTRLGVSPHAPYTVTGEDLAACVKLAAKRPCPLTIHALETTEERDWMLVGNAFLQGLLESFKLPSAKIDEKRGVLAWLGWHGVLRPGSLLAHVNYIDDAGLKMLSGSGAGVVWCPRAHAYYGHVNHRWREMLALGIPVCIGTDSAPASGTLSILDELRYLRQHAPEIPAETLLALGTRSGAAALGLADLIGALTPGRRADIAATPWDSAGPNEPCTNLLEGRHVPVGTWVNGIRVWPTHAEVNED